MTNVVRRINEVLATSEDAGSVKGIAHGDDTKFPHVICGVMLLMREKPHTKRNLSEAFSEVIRELQRKSYLKRGTIESTAKGVRLVRELQRSSVYHELSEEYQELLKKFRRGREEEYKGKVPLR